MCNDGMMELFLINRECLLLYYGCSNEIIIEV
jgi:hypothetical protein